MLKPATIERFQCAVRDELGREVSIQEAHDMLSTLVQFFSILAKYDHDDHQNDAR